MINKMFLIATLALCSKGFAANLVSSSAIRYHSPYAISEIGVQLLEGADLRSGKTRLKGLADEIDLENLEFYDDGERVLLPPLRHIAAFILDRRTDGEVRYQYDATYRHLKIHRETLIRDNYLLLKATVRGRPISSQYPGYGIVGRLWTATVSIECRELSDSTTITLSATAQYSLSANCCIVHNAAVTRAPSMVRSEISGALRRSLAKGRSLAVKGQESPIVMVHALLHDLSVRGFRR